MEPISISAANPGPMTGGGNRTYLVTGRHESTLVDAGVGAAAHLEDLTRALEQHASRLTRVVATHAHGDHIAGAASIRDRHPSAVFLKYPWPGEDDKHGVAWQPVADGTALDAGGETLIVLHTPGHSPDHIALWHEPSGTVFSGDLVIAGSSVMIEASRGGDLQQYLDALQRLRALQPRRLLPAHGPDIEAPEGLLLQYIDHRMQRERQVIEALARGHRTVPGITESIYDGLSSALMRAAQENVRAHLDKLAREGRIVADDQEFTLS